MANCMTQSKGLSLKYWVEFINYENYIVNNTPTKDLKNITLEEIWNNINPNVIHFHVFCSVAWAHILDEKRKALHSKSDKCIFVGYSEDVKGYKLLQPYCNEIIIRRDVKFDENVLACKPNSMFVLYSSCNPYSMFVPSFVPILVSSSSSDYSVDENLPPPSHLPLDESIEHETKPTTFLPRWVPST
jgi:hypothetical protein